MEHLSYALSATVPVFLLMLAGVFLRRRGIMTESFARGANTYVFKIALPLNLFVQLADISLFEVWDTGFVIFCLSATVLSIFLACLIARLFVQGELRGEFVQAAYRSSASLLGMALIENLYGTVTVGSLMILGSVPAYNVAAVIVLSLLGPAGGIRKGDIQKTLRGILTNPIILGVLGGFLVSCLPWKMPGILRTTLGDIGKTATPLGLMAMGAQMETGKIRERLKEASLAGALKLVGFGILFLPLAILLGFRGEKLIAIVVMLGSATTVAGYIMARQMGHEGALTQATVMLTTVLSAFTLTFWIYLVRLLGYV
ncbi:MAG: AEC family transporter [Clostridia bacterium]|nr:AEC family transporter [Clostridia bacterium]MBR2287049.1 AEC family transporter [Clostridia bacterium]